MYLSKIKDDNSICQTAGDALIFSKRVCASVHGPPVDVMEKGDVLGD